MNYLNDLLLGYFISSINTYFCTEEDLDNSPRHLEVLIVDNIIIILSGLIYTNKVMYNQAYKLAHYLKRKCINQNITGDRRKRCRRQ